MDCRTCGACCIDWECRGQVPDLLEGDVDRLSDRYRRNYVVHSFVARNMDGLASRECNGVWQCQALRGTVGQRVSCAIYARRPYICRTFRKGGTDCRECRDELRRVGRLTLEVKF